MVMNVNIPESIGSWLTSSTDNSVTLIGYIVVSLGVWLTAKQWRKDQNWKQKEAVLNRITAFGNTPGAHNAELMLWSAKRHIPLWAKDSIQERYVTITRKQVIVALIPKTYLPLIFSPFEDAIRDSFEDFFSKLSLIEVYLESKLLKKKDVKVVIIHLIRTFKNLKKGDDFDKQLIRNLYIFIDSVKFHGIKKLLKRYGIDINEELKSDILQLKEEIADRKWTRSIEGE